MDKGTHRTADHAENPEADTYCDYEIPYDVGHPAEETGDRMMCSLYADEMPVVKREVLVEAALAGWV